jgi:hypothetical protein
MAITETANQQRLNDGEVLAFIVAALKPSILETMKEELLDTVRDLKTCLQQQDRVLGISPTFPNKEMILQNTTLARSFCEKLESDLAKSSSLGTAQLLEPARGMTPNGYSENIAPHLAASVSTGVDEAIEPTDSGNRKSEKVWDRKRTRLWDAALQYLARTNSRSTCP